MAMDRGGWRWMLIDGNRIGGWILIKIDGDR